MEPTSLERELRLSGLVQVLVVLLASAALFFLFVSKYPKAKLHNIACHPLSCAVSACLSLPFLDGQRFMDRRLEHKLS